MTTENNNPPAPAARRGRCPSCGGTVLARPGIPTPCAGCGAKLTLKGPAAAAPAGEPPSLPPDSPTRKRAEAAPAPEVEDARPDPDEDRPRRHPPGGAKRKARRAAEAARRKRLLLVAGAGGGILLVVLTVGGLWVAVAFSGGRGPTQAAGGPREPTSEPGPPPFPPTPWAVLPGAGPTPAALPPVVPGGYDHWRPLPGPRAEYLAARADKNNRGIVVRGAADEAGRLTELGVLESATPRYSGLWGEFSQPSLADVAPDGRLALFTRTEAEVHTSGPTTRGAVRVWPAGAAGAPLPGSIDCALTGWIGWTARGRLLVLSDGKLAAWDPATGKKVLDFPGTHPGTAAVPPSRAWVVVSVEGKYLEVLDAEDGNVLGRLPGAGTWFWLTVSPDGTRLAGLKGDDRIRGPGEGRGPLAVQVWDLTKGEPEATVQLDRSNSDRLAWVGSTHLALLQNDPPLARAHLIDPAAKASLGRLLFPHDAQRDNGPQPLAGGPDGRLWWQYKGYQFTVPLQAPADDTAAFRPGTTVAVTAATGDARRDQEVVAALTARLEKDGFRVGAGEWAYHVTGAEDDGGGVMSFGPGKEVKIPEVQGHIQLTAPDGSVVVQIAHGGAFPRTMSRYYLKTKRPLTGGLYEGQVIATDYYDFGGQDPRAAMAGEAWERFVKHLAEARLPRTIRKDGNKYVAEEVSLKLTPPPDLAGLFR